MSEVDVSSYEPIFYPESLAVIGASDNPLKFGGLFLKALFDHGYKGNIYPVNPRAGIIQGLQAYSAVESIPEPVDFAVITVPAPLVKDAVRGCVKKGVKGAEILSSGFREAGPEGASLEDEVARIAREGGLRLIGPNGFGLYTPEVGITLMPGVDFSRTPGPVGFFSQSGGGACDVAYSGRGRNVYFSVMVSYGNGMDIDAPELLRYFAADDRTRIVGGYLEGVSDGRDFYEALRECAAKKPVVILKGGQTEAGNRGTLGHTGSMAGSVETWEAVMKSAGAVMARDSRDLVEMLMAFSSLDEFYGGGAGILGGGGMRCVDGLDSASTYGFPVPELDEDSADRIQAMLPPAGGRGANPVDLANPVMSPAVINPAMEILADREDIEFLVIYQMLFYLLNEGRRYFEKTGEDSFRMEYHPEIIEKALDLRGKTGKPLIMVLPDLASDPAHSYNEVGRIEARYQFTKNGVPCFDTGLQAFSVLRRVADYYATRRTRQRGED
ncbi:MAG: CoA-binding protein [bacterium]